MLRQRLALKQRNASQSKREKGVDLELGGQEQQELSWGQVLIGTCTASMNTWKYIRENGGYYLKYARERLDGV